MLIIKKMILYIIILLLLPVIALAKSDEEVSDELGDSKNKANEIPELNKSTPGNVFHEVAKGKVYEEKIFQLQGYVYALGNYYDEYEHNDKTKSQTSSMELNLEMNFKPVSCFGIHLDGGGKLNTEEGNTPPVENSFVTNEGYISMQSELVNITCGKKRTIIGSGLMLEPLDIVNPQKSLPGQEAQKEGNYLAQLNISKLFDNKNFSQIYFDAIYYWPVKKDKNGLPEEWLSEKENVVYLSRIGGVFFESDMALYYIYKWKTNHIGFSFSRYVYTALEFHLETLIFNKRHPALNQLYLSNNEKIYNNTLIGFRYSGINKFNATLDYYYQQDGLSQSEWEAATGFNFMLTRYYLYNASKSFERAPQLTLRRHYIAGNINYMEMFDYFNLNLTAIYGIDDGGWLIFPKVDYLPSSNSSIGAGALFLIGKGDNYQYKIFNFQYMITLDATVHF